MSRAASTSDEIPDAGRAELVAFGWVAEREAGPLVLGRFAAVAAAAGGWQVNHVATGARLAELPTASAVRRFAAKAEGIADIVTVAPRLAAATLEEELTLSREAVGALERAVADLEDQINDLMAKDALFAEDR
jgi:hypothetical protein